MGYSPTRKLSAKQLLDSAARLTKQIQQDQVEQLRANRDHLLANQLVKNSRILAKNKNGPDD